MSAAISKTTSPTHKKTPSTLSNKTKESVKQVAGKVRETAVRKIFNEIVVDLSKKHILDWFYDNKFKRSDDKYENSHVWGQILPDNCDEAQALKFLGNYRLKAPSEIVFPQPYKTQLSGKDIWVLTAFFEE